MKFFIKIELFFGTAILKHLGTTASSSTYSQWSNYLGANHFPVDAQTGSKMCTQSTYERTNLTVICNSAFHEFNKKYLL